MQAVLASVVAGLAFMTPGDALKVPAPGVPDQLAALRRSTIRDVRYQLKIRVPSDRAEPVTGTAELRFLLVRPLDSLALDFAGRALHSAVLDDHPVVPVVSNEHIVLPGPLEAGAHHVRLAFASSDAPFNRSDDFLYTLFVPARARQAFPCFDQPDLKARLSLLLDLPEGWRAVANGAEVGGSTTGGRTTLAFHETLPLSTYIMGFAAGRFSVEVSERRGRHYRMFHRETDAAKLDRNREAVFDLHASAMDWMEDYTGIRHPWGKFDFFLVPAFQFGGMEHAGSVFYNAPALLLEPSATTNQLLGRASLIAHEVAHMWFGNYVTMRWFDDVWMKEVFANFMAAKIVSPSFPEIDHQLRFLMAHYRAAYDVDRTPGTHPIRQPLANLADAGSLYGAIIYQKAPIVMRQLERLMGEEELRKGLREYLERYAFGNASWTDLVTLLDARSRDDLSAWSDVWVGQPGRPEVVTTLTAQDGRVEALVVEQRDPAGAGRVWPQALEIELGTADASTRLPVVLRTARTAVSAAVGLPAPDYVLATGGGWGYGRFVVSDETIGWLVRHLPDLPAGLSRGAAWVTLWEEMLEGRLTPTAAADLALRALETERDALNVQRFLSDVEALYRRFLSPADRERLVPRLESSLERGLGRAEDPSLKGAWFRSLVRTARTARLVAWLTEIWRHSEQVPGLELAEPDFVLLAQELAVREAPGWREILSLQQERITNPDRRDRFAFVRPALDSAPEARTAFFQSLYDVERRRHEAWVLEAVSYLHHPLRAGASAPLVLPGLLLLQEIQQTGDIFFPKRWMDATLGGHRSAEIVETIDRFLDERPAYSERLRRIIIQSADELRRIARGRPR